MVNSSITKVMEKAWLSDEDYMNASTLIEACNKHERLKMRVELEKRRAPITDAIIHNEELKNNFLYFLDGKLVGYLWLYGFWGNQAETSAVVHPDYRSKGIFSKLLSYGCAECRRRNITKLLIISEPNSVSSQPIINKLGLELISTEYKMQLNKDNSISSKNDSMNLIIRAANQNDGYSIAKQNAIYFLNWQEGDGENFLEDIPSSFDDAYMAELDGAVIGKVHVLKDSSGALICGLGVLPGFRNKGYGRRILSLTVQKLVSESVKDIYLEVESKNSHALNLYKSCGFEEVVTYNYYMYPITA